MLFLVQEDDLARTIQVSQFRGDAVLFGTNPFTQLVEQFLTWRHFAFFEYNPACLNGLDTE
jgi:hypothetical protein